MSSVVPHVLTGVIPPVCTPLTAEREVDIDSYGRLLDFLLDSGVDGLFLLGSTSEVAFLTDSQRDTVLRAGVDRVAGQVPVLVGLMDMTTARVIEHARAAMAVGVDGLVASAPFYTRTHVTEIDQHFREIKKAIGDMPLYAYDVPVSANGVKLDREMLLRLGEDGVLAGVKDSSGDDAGLRGLIVGRDQRGLANFSILTGSELTVDSAFLMGADGVVPGIGNVDPVGYVTLYRLCQEENWKAAREEQERLYRMFPLVDIAPTDRMGRGSSALGAFKAGLYLRGIIDNPITALPAIPLSDSEIAGVREYLVAGGLL